MKQIGGESFIRRLTQDIKGSNSSHHCTPSLSHTHTCLPVSSQQALNFIIPVLYLHYWTWLSESWLYNQISFSQLPKEKIKLLAVSKACFLKSRSRRLCLAIKEMHHTHTEYRKRAKLQLCLSWLSPIALTLFLLHKTEGNGFLPYNEISPARWNPLPGPEEALCPSS